MKTFKKSLFVFRRDLRLDDNAGLLQALEQSEAVVPLFIFDDVQRDSKQNKYFSQRAFDFMVESLIELSDDCVMRGATLYCVAGDVKKIVEQLIINDAIDAVFINKDYTPFSKKRDAHIEQVCKKHTISFSNVSDYTLAPIEDILTKEGKPYSVFTPFMKNAVTYVVPRPVKNKHTNFYAGRISVPQVSLGKYATSYSQEEYQRGFARGGRKRALSILKKPTFLKQYKTQRNIMATSGTSELSPHHKFGTISIRETYHAAKKQPQISDQFIAELYWRDFYLHIAHHFPHVFGKSFLPWGDEIQWENNKKHFQAWCDGKTGVPIVDAGMRQLNETGWMHNRARMIVASFLSKNLLIDWRWGEQYFATKLIDYDPASNNGGWQWSASVGADPRPLRIFNPYTQAQKYDTYAQYIRRWVPELANIDTAILTDGKERDFSTYSSEYVAPFISCKETYHRARDAYRKAKNAFMEKQKKVR